MITQVVGDLPEEQVARIEPSSVCWHATNRAQIISEDILLVFGCGMIGLGTIAASGYKGAKVIVVDIDDLKLEKAKALRASYTINSQKENLEKKDGKNKKKKIFYNLIDRNIYFRYNEIVTI